jgi:hypothetical protein
LLAATATDGCAYGQPNLIARGRPIDALQYQIEVEPELQLADDHYRRRSTLQRDEIAAPDLALHVKSQVLKEPFDWEV